MRAASTRPRPDQIAELTRGLQLPLPAVSGVHLDIIAEGLLQAFGEIRAQAPAIIASGTEAEVTALMEARLNAMIEVDPFWGQLVLCVARGKESLSFDGSHLEKRPDISIYLSNRNRSFPLVAEAKIIDAAASKTETMYCDNGVRRFVEGEYAWGSREAFIMAYVRDGSSIDTKLTPFLSNVALRTPPGYLVERLPLSAGWEHLDLARSVHGRSFHYASKSTEISRPGSITLWHLWLS